MKKIIVEEPLHRKDYTKSKKKLSGVDDEMLQAIGRAGDDDLDTAFSKVGMGVNVDYYPLTSMSRPFKVSFTYTSIGSSVPVSWMGEKSSTDGTVEEEDYVATIWLSPNSFKKIQSGTLEKDYYKFKVVNINSKKPKSDFLFFKADQINIDDRVTKEISPRLILDKKYDIGLKLGDVVDQGGGENEEDTNGEDNKEVAIPKEISSGKNRNEIFRLLLNKFGGFKGNIVYGDGFKSIELAKEYSKLQKAVKSGNVDKSKLKEFREKANRDAYSMMIANLRKSFPKTFLGKLSKAFPEFNITFSKESMDENTSKIKLLEEANPDKNKRWNMVFPGGVIGGKPIETLDKNVREFMAAVKKWFAVPVKGFGGKSRSYTVNYDGDAVNAYWNKFYGNKNESKLSLFNVLNEVVGGVLKENSGKKRAELVFNKIFIKGMKKAQKNQDSDIDTDVVNASGGGKPIKVADFSISESYIDKIKEEAKKFSIVDTEINDILNILKDLKDKTVKVENKPEKSIFLLGKTSLGKNLFLNIPIKNNGVNLRGLNKLLSVGSDFKNCGFAYARPNKPFITNGIDIKLKLTN
jgi:hypothetical protein